MVSDSVTVPGADNPFQSSPVNHYYLASAQLQPPLLLEAFQMPGYYFPRGAEFYRKNLVCDVVDTLFIKLKQ